MREIDSIEADWPGIEGIIQSKMNRMVRSVQVQELPELKVGHRAKIYAMRKFAQEHSGEGVKLDAHGGLFGLPMLRQTTDGAAPPEDTLTGGSGKVSPIGQGTPALARYSTTYVLGDDRYDRSFVIEGRNGEFIGECGIGIWETIGVGSPRRVIAFEVWLFDKEDIRTVTRVLMSDYAFRDVSLRLKAALRSDAALVEEGKIFSLDTDTLHLRARIPQAVYGTGDVPQRSYFEELTADLEVWQSPSPAPGTETSTEQTPERA